MEILKENYFELYKKSLKNFKLNFDDFIDYSKKVDFEYLTETSGVFSSNIEWNSLDISSFKNLKLNKSITKDVKEIENLISTYSFARDNKLNEKNLLLSHKISSETLLIKSRRWKYRNDKVWVFWKEWLVYLAIEAELVGKEMWKLFKDIKNLLNSNLTSKEIFYYASMIHLVFVHIHPFPDWNGRSARLLEKWFLSEKIGKDLWKIRSEEYYWNNRNLYYTNINLWVNYYELNYNNAIPFLLMLPQSLNK